MSLDTETQLQEPASPQVLRSGQLRRRRQKCPHLVHCRMLPNAQQATVDPSKVRDYLLSPTHPIGHFKGVVFNALGYTVENWPLLVEDLIALARSEPAVLGRPSPYGEKYEVSGKLTGPNGRSAKFTTVWLLKTGDRAPRFVTATPE